MARPLPIRKKKNLQPLDHDEFIERIKLAKFHKDEIALEAYRNTFWKFPREVKAALRKEGITL
jgi:hypothetical protein|tara:strand:+ start:282 stop:470 length:189 start_codon:yes stop_codon:yes gene_type:complete